MNRINRALDKTNEFLVEKDRHGKKHMTTRGKIATVALSLATISAVGNVTGVNDDHIAPHRANNPAGEAAAAPTTTPTSEVRNESNSLQTYVGRHRFELLQAQQKHDDTYYDKGANYEERNVSLYTLKAGDTPWDLAGEDAMVFGNDGNPVLGTDNNPIIDEEIRLKLVNRMLIQRDQGHVFMPGEEISRFPDGSQWDDPEFVTPLYAARTDITPVQVVNLD